jgi:uncharacterized protein (TIGR00369 family)
MAESGTTFGVAPLETMKSMSGLEFLRSIADGRLPAPPIAQTLGFHIAEVSQGYVRFEMTPEFKHYNPLGGVHGGVAATLLDSCMSCAVHTHLPAGTGYTTMEIKINFVRALTDKAGLIRAEGRTLHVGRRASTAEGKIVDANGTLYAHGTTTCMILQL